jgi:hypothetical protein
MVVSVVGMAAALRVAARVMVLLAATVQMHSPGEILAALSLPALLSVHGWHDGYRRRQRLQSRRLIC